MNQKDLGQALIEICKKNGWRISCAESCTGGSLCGLLTEFSGVSAVFERGFITYSNQSKIEMLGVSPQTLEQKGAVSEETAREMVLGAQKNAKTEIAVAITGIAGPLGGTDLKPVGTVFIGFTILNKVWVEKFSFAHLADIRSSKNLRLNIRKLAIESALNVLVCELKTTSGIKNP